MWCTRHITGECGEHVHVSGECGVHAHVSGECGVHVTLLVSVVHM